MAKFTKGQSGNPGGRPKALGDLRELAREHTASALQVLLKVMEDPKAASSARVGAASAVLDRGWGRAPQSFEINQESKVPGNPGLLSSALLSLIKPVGGEIENKSANRRTSENSGDVESEIEVTPPVDVTH